MVKCYACTNDATEGCAGQLCAECCKVAALDVGYKCNKHKATIGKSVNVDDSDDELPNINAELIERLVDMEGLPPPIGIESRSRKGFVG